MTITNKNIWRELPIRGKLLLPIVLFVSVGVLFFGYASFKAISKTILDEQRNALVLLSETLVSQVDTFLEALETNVVEWGGSPIITTAVENSFLGRSARPVADEYLLQLRQKRPYIDYFIVVDEKGMAVSSDSEIIPGNMSVANQEYFIKSLSGERSFSNVFISGLSGVPVFVISVPIKDVFGAIKGVFLAAIKMEYFNEKVIRPVHVGVSGYAMVYNKEGVVIAHEDKFNILDLNVLDLGLDLGEITNISQGVVNFEEEGRGYSASIHRISRLNWWFSVVSSNEDVLRPLNKIRTILLGIGACLLAFAVLVVYWSTNSILDRIQLLSERLELMSTEESSEELEVNSSDEVGRLVTSFNRMVVIRKKYVQKLEAALQVAEQSSCALADQKYAMDQHAIVAVTDIKGTITFANSMFSEISGYSKEELLGSNHRILKSKEHDKNIFREMYLTISSGKVWKGDLCNRAKNGSLYWVDTTIVPFMKDGNPESYVAIRNDITERRMYQSQLIEAKETAESAVIAKSEFLATMSHEIRTPMNGVLGMLGLLLNEDLRDDQRHKAAIAKSSADALLVIINDILDFSKVDAGKIELEAEHFNLTAHLGEFAKSMALKAQEKGLELVLDLVECEQSNVIGDSGRLRQILTNLVGNAIKFTSSGEIIIRGKLKKLTESEVVFYCSVTDTGIGIPKDKMDMLFDSFSQVDASTTREYGGTGLGLSIAQRFCELMGGSLGVQSELGRGSCFVFSVDLLQSDQCEPDLGKPKIHDMPILVADGNLAARELVKKQLEKWGARVTEACSGEKLLQILDERYQRSTGCTTSDNEMAPFKMVFLDLQASEVNGEALCKLIRQNPKYNQLQLILMIPITRLQDESFYSQQGFSGFFSKPFTKSDFCSVWEMVSDNSGSVSKAEGGELQRKIGVAERSNEAIQNTKILLVEDNVINQEVAVMILSDFNVSADIAANGIEAIELLKGSLESEPYQLILLDCLMPEMDGYEATKAIRSGVAGDLFVHIPIIAMTANAMKGDREKCLASGMDDYMTKPIDPDRVEEVIQRWANETPPVTNENTRVKGRGAPSI